jgi:hypothetical protein
VASAGAPRATSRGKPRRQRMNRLYAVLIVGTLIACGGDDVADPTPLPDPAPPPPVTYDGTYTGTSMTFTGGGGQSLVTCSTTITQTGSNLSFSDMEVTDLGSFGMGAAVLTNNTFDGTNQYASQGCGMVSNHYSGWFSGDGNLMNMTTVLTSDDCGQMDLRGEMSRSTLGSHRGASLSIPAHAMTMLSRYSMSH